MSKNKYNAKLAYHFRFFFHIFSFNFDPIEFLET